MSEPPPSPPMLDERLGALLKRHWKMLTGFAAGLAVAGVVVGIVLEEQAAEAPREPNFVVESTDWRQTGTTTESCPGLRGTQELCAGAVYSAHAIVRNQGASGSAVVTLSNGRHSCTATIQANVGQVTEVACRLQPLSYAPSYLAHNPPTATVGR